MKYKKFDKSDEISKFLKQSMSYNSNNRFREHDSHDFVSSAAKIYTSAVPKGSLMPKSYNSIATSESGMRGGVRSVGLNSSTPKATKTFGLYNKDPQRKTRRNVS
jgi:hypothetical protein